MICHFTKILIPSFRKKQINGHGFSPASGFTLLEIMISIAVLGVGLTLMTTIFKQNNEINKKGQDFVIAVIAGQKKMEELIQKGYNDLSDQSKLADKLKPIEFIENGEIVNPKYRWLFDVTQQEKDLLKLKVQVLWPWPENTHYLDFSTLLANRE